MAAFDFDTLIDRKNTNSLKYDFAVERGRPADVLPLWVADMDFQAPSCVLEALQKSVAHGIFGYSDTKADYDEAVIGWFSRRFGWEARAEWLVKTPGVVFALAAAIRAATRPGDAVLVQSPVYYPFYSVIRDNDRKVVESELVYQDGRYSIDFDDLEWKISEQQVKLLLLCSPHNPVGRVWTPEELRQIGALCARYDVTVISDEIHCDFAFPEHPHIPFLLACPELADQAVVCTAPSKSFNLAGLQASNIFIPNEELRRRFLHEIDRTGYSQLNTLGLVACQAAYEGGEQWLDACKAYMRGNLDFLRDYLREHTDLRVLWLEDDLKAYRQEHPEDLLYYRLDTHWNLLGGYIGARAVLKELGVTIPEPSALEKTKKDLFCDGRRGLVVYAFLR